MLRTICRSRKFSPVLPKTKFLSSTARVIDVVNPPSKKTTVGGYLAKRLADNGLYHYFTVPGDFTLALLDELIKEKRLNMISCCNELNAGYAADGYSRATGGLAAVCVTYMYA